MKQLAAHCKDLWNAKIVHCNRTSRHMNIGWKGLTTFSLLRLTRDYEDDILRRELFICDRNWGKNKPLVTFWTMSRIEQSSFQRHFPYQNVLQNLRVRKWLENSQLFRTAAKHMKMQPRNWQRTVFPWLGSWLRNLAMTQESVGKDREINVILNRQAALTENMLHWSFPPTLSFPWHHPAVSSGSVSGSPGLQRVIRLEEQGPQGPKAYLLLTRHWPQQCPPQIPPTQIRLYCCNNIASSSSDSWRVIRQKTHSHKQL